MCKEKETAKAKIDRLIYAIERLTNTLNESKAASIPRNEGESLQEGSQVTA